MPQATGQTTLNSPSREDYPWKGVGGDPCEPPQTASLGRRSGRGGLPTEWGQGQSAPIRPGGLSESIDHAGKYFGPSFHGMAPMQGAEILPPRSADAPAGKETAGPAGQPTPLPSPTAHRVLVAYGSRFGNTQRIAEALARGLRRVPGVEADCLALGVVSVSDLRGYDLMAIGGPTEMFSASQSMKEFLERLPAQGLAGKRGFAFETRLKGRLSGSAGRYIERRLEAAGAELVRPPLTAFVRAMTKEERALHGSEGAPEWARRLDKNAAQGPPSPPASLDLLFPGSEAEFEKVGAEIAAVLVAR